MSITSRINWLNRAAALLLVTLIALPGAAQELSFTASVASQSVRDDGFFVLSDTDVTVNANLALGYEVFENLSVFGEYATGSQRNDLLSNLQMDFAVHAARVGVQYRYPLLPFLHPYVQAGMGFYWGDIDLESVSTTYDDTDFGVGGFVLGGLALIWYFGDPEQGGLQRMGVGLTNDYGYTFGPNLSFNELRPESGDEPGPDVNLGEVDLSGFTWRIGLTVRYRF